MDNSWLLSINNLSSVYQCFCVHHKTFVYVLICFVAKYFLASLNILQFVCSSQFHRLSTKSSFHSFLCQIIIRQNIDCNGFDHIIWIPIIWETYHKRRQSSNDASLQPFMGWTCEWGICASLFILLESDFENRTDFQIFLNSWSVVEVAFRREWPMTLFLHS